MDKMIKAQEVSCKKFVPRRALMLCMAVMMVMVMTCFVSADEPTQTIVDASAYKSLFDILTAQLNVQAIVGVIGACLGVCVGLVFLWWGARKALSMLMSAFKKGKVSI